MKLFHFTAGQFLGRIKLEGLRKGVIPWSMNRRGEVGMVPGWQWLTANATFGMEWARPSPHSARRFRTDEFRIEVEVPERFRSQLIKWTVLRDQRVPDSREFLDTFPDHTEWWLYKGLVSPTWFGAIDKNPYPESLILPELN